MSHNSVDYQQIKRVLINCENTDGTRVQSTIEIDNEDYKIKDFYCIPILISSEEVESLLEEYDPESGTSPSVSVSRPLARLILDALKRKTEEEEQK